ncbi:MAG: hypothetical protein EOM37_06335 [Proteobacteria bacterium]|nr:hypothetical protein [Pseudomonadota bacterium]
MIISAGALAEATRPALPKRKTRTHRPRPVALTYDRFIQALRVSEARCGTFQITVPLSTPAVWPEEIIVDGVLLVRVVATFAPEALITLTYDDAVLTLHCGRACVRINRIEERKKRACRGGRCSLPLVSQRP